MEYKETDIGRCETCGFFSKHSRSSDTPTPRFYEVEIRERTDTNHIFSYYTSTSGIRVNCEIACFRHKVDFMREINRLGDQGARDRKLVEMVRADRHCEAWRPYRPGFSPMEHYAEVAMERLEANRRDYEQRTEDARRRYEKGLTDAADAERRQFEGANQARNSALIIASIIVGSIIGVAQIIAQIIAAAISNHESFTDKILRRLFGQ